MVFGHQRLGGREAAPQRLEWSFHTTIFPKGTAMSFSDAEQKFMSAKSNYQEHGDRQLAQGLAELAQALTQQHGMLQSIQELLQAQNRHR